MRIKLVFIAFSITRLYCLWAYLCSVGSRFFRQQHRRALRLVIKFLLCTVRHSALYSAVYSTVHWVWTPHYSISIIRAHTPHRPYSGTQLSLPWPTIHTTPHYRMTWYCEILCCSLFSSPPILFMTGWACLGWCNLTLAWLQTTDQSHRGEGGDTMFGPNTVVSCQPASKQNSFTAHNKALQTLAPGNHLS